MKNSALFSSKDKSKKSKCRLLHFLFGATRVKKFHKNGLLSTLLMCLFIGHYDIIMRYHFQGLFFLSFFSFFFSFLWSIPCENDTEI